MHDKNYPYPLQIFVALISVLAVLSLLAITSYLPSQNTAAQATIPNHALLAINFLPYENSTYGIKFQFPSNWYKIEILSRDVSDIQFIGPRNASDIRPATIDISIWKNLQNEMTLDQYSKVADNLLKQTYGTFNTSKWQPTTLGGFSAIQRVFSIKQPFLFDIQGSQIFTIKNNKAYVVTYTAQASKYFDKFQIMRKMVDSFQITGNNGIKTLRLPSPSFK